MLLMPAGMFAVGIDSGCYLPVHSKSNSPPPPHSPPCSLTFIYRFGHGCRRVNGFQCHTSECTLDLHFPSGRWLVNVPRALCLLSHIEGKDVFKL